MPRDSDSSIEAWGSYLALIEEIDPEIAAAGVRRLASLGKSRAAARLAIAHWVHAPQLVSEIQNDVDSFSGGLPEAHIRLTGFSTTHGLAVDLGRAFAACGYRPSVSEAEYGQVVAELMQPSTESRDALMVLLDIERSPRTGVAAERERRL